MPTYVTTVNKNMQEQHRFNIQDSSFNILTNIPNITKTMLRLLDKDLTEILKMFSSQKVVYQLEDRILMQKRST